MFHCNHIYIFNVTLFLKLDFYLSIINFRRYDITDINSQLGKDGNNKICQHNSPNKKGAYLADFSLDNRLEFLMTKFQKGRKTMELYT